MNVFLFKLLNFIKEKHFKDTFLNVTRPVNYMVVNYMIS